MTWYVVDGMDGSGKSSVGDLIYKRLTDEGRRVMIITHPNDSCRSGRLAAKYLKKHGKGAMLLSTTFYIFNVLHSLRIKKKTKDDYDDYIFVRYNMAVAYLPKSLNKSGYKVISAILPMPDVKIFVDIDPKIAMQRILSRGEELEMFETEEKLEKTRNKMLALTDDWIIVDNSQSYDQTVTSVNWVLDELKNKNEGIVL